MDGADMQRTVICMYDGFGFDYFEESPLPVMKRMAREGFHKKGKAIFPTLTNANNISIICASWPEKHGVTTNCFFDEATNTARFLEDADLILVPTIFRRFRSKGVRSALLTCKDKTLKLVGRDTDFAVAAEAPSADIVARYGAPPPMYSAEVNYWLWTIALDILSNRPDIGLIYVHTTDYPMHKWAAQDPRSLEHMARLDELLGAASSVSPDTNFLITADHGMNPKRKCIDLRKTCALGGIDLRFSVSPVADRLLEHHRGFGGVSYVYLRSEKELPAVRDFLAKVPGVDKTLTRHEAAGLYHLMPERVGDIIVLADKETVFGDLPEAEEELARGYRNHGSLYEQDIPLIAYGFAGNGPDPEEMHMNFDLTQWLCSTYL
ncbi:MAG: alkaline phosphatase family protein [Nitrospirae bacterium]|nr:alkaline phosphatase family protein [Nitrospirota bacterium]